ncbi:MAG: ABC transporter permease subunit [Streptococcaceae bacterium]|jgi:NitT/TauT family transport system permease protein|nr:ABC transporter permease subunit [Streptococcaceae bacterium]
MIAKIEKWLAVIGIIVALISHQLIPRTVADFTKQTHWYLYFLILMLGYKFVQALFNHKKAKVKAKFVGAVFIALAFYDLATEKMQWIKPLYFPSPEKILNVFFKDTALLAKCWGYSIVLLGLGLLLGIIVGLLTGVLVGWFKEWNYWLDPIIKVVGPIPSTAFVPIALAAFATSFQAAVFLIAFSTWFPVTILTNSGIQNIKQSYFEVADTLGASTFQKITRVAIPAALPQVFVGIFNGVCASFITLMTAEMLGVKFGLGWYINWQREVIAYANVYAGLITIAVTFSLIITLLFKVRDRVLAWQKGFIKW